MEDCYEIIYRMEQAVYVLLMLNLLSEHSVMTSTALSDRLNVSDSYLKKIIKALVKEGLVNSSTAKWWLFFK